MLDVDTARERIAALSAERKKLDDASDSRAETLARVGDHVAAQAEQFGAQLARRLFEVAQGADPSHLLRMRLPGGLELDLGPILAALLGPRALGKALAGWAASSVPEGMPKEDRRAAVAAIDDELVVLAVREELALRQIEAAGHEVIRRRDALPAVVLAPDDELQGFAP